MEDFIKILFKGMWNGYIKHLNFIDDHWAYGQLKIPEYTFTISVADAIFQSYGGLGRNKVLVEANVKLINYYSVSIFGGSSFALPISTYQKITKPKQRQRLTKLHTIREHPKKVDILVCDKRASYIPKYVIEMKGINPPKKDICEDIYKIKSILNHTSATYSRKYNKKNSVELGFILGMTRLDSPRKILDTESIQKKMEVTKEAMEQILQDERNNSDLDFRYQQNELDFYSEENYLSHPDPDKDINEARALTHAYISWVIQIGRKGDTFLTQGLTIDDLICEE